MTFCHSSRFGMWQPINENETEVYSWFAVDSAAPEEYKKNSYKAYLMCFGSTGMFEQDDVENWVSLTNTAAGFDGTATHCSTAGWDCSTTTAPLSNRFRRNSSAGLVSRRSVTTRHNQRALLNLWADHLEMAADIGGSTAVGTNRIAIGAPCDPAGSHAREVGRRRYDHSSKPPATVCRGPVTPTPNKPCSAIMHRASSRWETAGIQ